MVTEAMAARRLVCRIIIGHCLQDLVMFVVSAAASANKHGFTCRAKEIRRTLW